MQGLLKKLVLIFGGLTSLGCFAQSNNETVPAKTNQSAPVISNGATFNNNSNTTIQLEENSIKAVPAAKEKSQFEAKPESLKKSLTSQEAPAVTRSRMQQQFRLNQTNSSRQYSRRSATIQEQNAMDESVFYFRTVAPESFESAFYSWLAGHYDISRIEDLRKAEKLQPDNIEVLKQKAMYYAVSDKKDSLSIVLQKLDTLDYYSYGQLMYAEDLLLSCDDKSTLIVHGFDDFLAASYMNNPDERVNVVSLDLMQSEDYRDLCAKKIAVPQQKEVNVEFLQKLCGSSQKPLFLSMTIPSNYLQPLKDNLYVQGLAFVYSKNTLDTYRKNDALWFSKMNKLLPSEQFSEDAFRVWMPNYKVMLSVLKTQLNTHQSEIPADDLEYKLEDIDNQLEYIMQNTK